MIKTLEHAKNVQARRKSAEKKGTAKAVSRFYRWAEKNKHLTTRTQ